MGLNRKQFEIYSKMVWLIGINLLSFGTAEKSMMRIVNTNVAYELKKTVELNN